MGNNSNPNNNPIEDLSFDFAVRIVKFCGWLKKESKQFEMANQLLRCGTSIGANVAEAQYAQSKADFASKMHIALKEAYETEYWLRLLSAADIIPKEACASLQADLKQILKLLITIVKKAKS